jgi:hypothetical protein
MGEFRDATPEKGDYRPFARGGFFSFQGKNEKTY